MNTHTRACTRVYARTHTSYKGWRWLEKILHNINKVTLRSRFYNQSFKLSELRFAKYQSVLYQELFFLGLSFFIFMIKDLGDTIAHNSKTQCV